MLRVDWDDVRVFLELADAGSLGKAARRLRVSQATVWRRVTNLQATVEAPLFVRRPEGYALTASGHELSARLRNLPDQIGEALRALRFTASTPGQSPVRVMAPDFLMGMASQAVADLGARAPAVELDCTNGSPEPAHCDILITLEPRAIEGMRLDSAHLAELGAYASRRYLAVHGEPASRSEAEAHRWIGTPISGGAAIGARPEAATRPDRLAFVSRSVWAQAQACRAGAGLAVLPCIVADPEPDLVQVLREVSLLPVEVSLYMRQEASASVSVHRVRDALAQALSDLDVRCSAPARARA
jgi:DNA-binding transcriptional LysR family regulator